jgi:hypothetical protein
MLTVSIDYAMRRGILARIVDEHRAAILVIVEATDVPAPVLPLSDAAHAAKPPKATSSIRIVNFFAMASTRL